MSFPALKLPFADWVTSCDAAQDVGRIGSPRIRFFPVVHLARAFLKNLTQKVLAARWNFIEAFRNPVKDRLYGYSMI